MSESSWRWRVDGELDIHHCGSAFACKDSLQAPGHIMLLHARS